MVGILWNLALLNFLLGSVLAQSSDKQKVPVITKQPSNVAAVRGGTAELICNAEGAPPLRYEWYHNGKRIQSTRLRTITNTGNLYFFRVATKRRKIPDTGSYYCTVTNNFGRVKSQTVNLTIGFIKSSFRKHPVNQSVLEGSKVVLTCTPPRGKPKPKLTWYKDDRPMSVDGQRILLQKGNQKLVIKNFKKDNEGTYFCEATNVAGRSLSHSAVLVRKVPPMFVEKPKDATVAVGSDSQVTFSCKANGSPPPEIVWKKQGSQTVLPSTAGTLILSNVKPSYEGIYTCSAQNSEGSISSDARLTVNYLPQFVHVPSDAHVKEGTELKLSCLANARPYPAILWYNEAKGIYYGIGMRYGTLRIEQDDRTISLIISPVKKSDEGTYTCKATNDIGTAKHDVKVLVHSVSENPPSITGRTDGNLKAADINSNITFICDINGNPKPSVSWFKVGHVGTLGDGIILKNFPLGEMHRYVLNIERVQESNAGIFQCQAVNKINTATKTFVLHVTKKLHIDETIGVGVPNMPTNVRGTQWNEDSVLIRWDRGQIGAADRVITYVVGYIEVDARSKEKYATSNVDSTRYVVKKLKPNTQYRFFVRGVNKNGRGLPSLLSDVVRTKALKPTAAVRSTPGNVNPLRNFKLRTRVRPGGPGQLIVSWRKAKTDKTIDGYYIYWKVKGRKTQFQQEILQNSQANRYIISDLQNSTTYLVEARAFQKTFKGKMSDVVRASTSPEAVLLKMNIAQNDSDSIKVEWKRLWKRNSGDDEVKEYNIWWAPVTSAEKRHHKAIPPSGKRYFIVGDLKPGVKYKVHMTVTTVKGHRYYSNEEFLTLKASGGSPNATIEKIKAFVQQPWFLGLLGGVVLILIIILLVYCLCKRSSSEKDASDLALQLKQRNQPESPLKPSESRSTESDIMTPRGRGRDSVSDCESCEGRSSRVYRSSGTPSTPTHPTLDFPEIAITPNKYGRLYRSLERRESDTGGRNGRYLQKFSDDDYQNPSPQASGDKSPYSPKFKPISLSGDGQSDHEKGRPKCQSHSSSRVGSPSRGLYPGEAPPDYETAIAENSPRGQSDNDDCNERSTVSKKLDDNNIGGVPYKSERCGNPTSRQSSCSPSSEYSNQGRSIAARRKGLKPPPRLTIASVNWADMLPPPPSHPPPSSVATRSPPPSPTGTSLCSETTYGRSHASSFLPRRSGSVVSGDMTSDLEKATTDSVFSGKSKGKSENKLPFDLAGITSDIIMQWADSVTNTSGSDNDSSCSSPSRVSGISSDGSFLTDTDFANAVKVAAECGGFNIDIDLNMYKNMDPISFQPFAGSLSTYNAESGGDPRKDSKTSSRKTSNGPNEMEEMRSASRSGRSRRQRPSEDIGDIPRLSKSPIKEMFPLNSSTPDSKNNRKPKKTNVMNTDGSSGYVPALTRTSALGKLEPVSRGPVKKKYAVVKTLPQVHDGEGANYPTHSLSSSTSNASTIRNSSCPAVLTDEDMEDDML